MWNILLLLCLIASVARPFSDKCPSPCKCVDKNGKGKVDCRGRGLQEMFSSSSLPTETRILDLSKNNITTIKSFVLDRSKRLEKLYLHKNNIRIIEPRAFVGLTNLNRLVLKQNNLIKLAPKAFVGLPELDSLDLSVNKIRSIDKDAFFGLKKLTRLNLNNNSFRTIENGTFDSLPKIKKMYFRNSPLRCDCDLNYFLQFITKLVRYDGTCFHSKTRLAALAGSDLCVPPPVLSLYPDVGQVVAIGDSLQIECHSEKQEALHLGWTKNEKALLTKRNTFILTKTVRDQIISSVELSSIKIQDAGLYACSSDRLGVDEKNVTVNVVSSRYKMCKSETILAEAGEFTWPVTFSGTTKKIPCPSIGQRSAVDTAVRRTCSQDGHWKLVNYGNCRWVPLSQQLIALEKLTSVQNMIDVSSKLKLLAIPEKFRSSNEISLVLKVVSSIGRRYADQLYPAQVLDNLLETFNNLMNVDDKILNEAQKVDQSPSRLASNLELISRKSAVTPLSRDLPNIVIGSIKMKKEGFQGKTCRVYFQSSHTDISGLHCRTQERQDHVVSIYLPKTIFTDLEKVGIIKEELFVQLLVYRNAKLFPTITNNNTMKIMKDRSVSTSVLAIQFSSISEMNLTEPFLISFKTDDGADPLVGSFDFGEREIGRTWSPNNDCEVKGTSDSKTTVHCRRLMNKNLAIISITKTVSDVVYSLEIIVYVGAVIAALFILATLLTFTIYKRLRFACDDVLVLMNACLSLLVVLITFAFGINRAESRIPCLAVGVLLHFFFLASLLWLGSYIVCVSRKLEKTKESTEEEFNPVMRYYMVSWGVPAVICGITLAGNLNNYHTSKYCWLAESAGLGGFVGPACLLFIVNCVLLVRLHLLLARGGVTRTPSIQDSEEEEPLREEEPAIVEITPQPGDAEAKSLLTLFLVATWVVMSLVYVNFIVAYLLIKFRGVTLTWKFLSYVYALANITLGASVFLFHCAARADVRECWKKTWARVKSIRFMCGCRRALGLLREAMLKKTQANGAVLATADENAEDSDRQSDITLPSSAALTNDIFANGRPLSNARISLLDEADFRDGNPGNDDGAVNEVDITMSEDGARCAQSHVSTAKSDMQLPGSKPPGEAPVASIPPEVGIAEGLLSEINDELHADITSKSESSAPTAIEVPLTSTPQRQSPPRAEHPRVNINPPSILDNLSSRSGSSIGVDAPVKMTNPKRKRSSESLSSRTGSVTTGAGSRLRMVPIQNGYPSTSSGSELAPRNPAVSKRQRFGDLPVMHEVNQPMIPPGLMTAQRMVVPNMPLGVMRPQDIAFQNMPPQNVFSSATMMAPQVPPPTRPSQPAKNCYKDGREKPEPKKWVGNGARQVTYVPVPHVSKIHKTPARNETSV